MSLFYIIIPKRLIGKRIDVALGVMLPDYSRAKIINWIKSGAIINNKTFKPKNKVVGEEVVELVIENLAVNDWQAENITLNVVFADDDIIVINKPVGLVTHPGSGNWNGTLANALLYYDARLAKLDRAGIVHRLDKNTSGILVVARSIKAQKNLVQQLQSHVVVREYYAIVYGYMVSGGKIEQPIGRDNKDRTKQKVVINGKQAITYYHIIKRFANHTLIKVILETGRTHQIRVHMAYILHPLVGDYIYNRGVRFFKNAHDALKTALKGFKRQALHAKKLTLNHPVTNKKMSWEAPLPEDMQNFIKMLVQYDKL